MMPEESTHMVGYAEYDELRKGGRAAGERLADSNATRSNTVAPIPKVSRRSRETGRRKALLDVLHDLRGLKVIGDQEIKFRGNRNSRRSQTVCLWIAFCILLHIPAGHSVVRIIDLSLTRVTWRLLTVT